MGLGTLSQKYRRLYGSLTMFQESCLDPCSTLEDQTWSNNQSQHDLLYGGVSLSIFLNLKLASPLGNSEMASRGVRLERA